MYTIKVVSINWSKTGGREIDDTLFLEAHENVRFKILQRTEGQTATQAVLDHIEIKGANEPYNHRINDESWSILKIDYRQNSGEFKTMFVYSSAEVYLMQNGKTIDKFII